MKEENPTPHKTSKPVPHKEKPEVYVLRDWKEYLGESALIIFSVLLALFLTEFITNLREKKETGELLKNIREELIANKKAEEEQYAYQKMVLKTSIRHYSIKNFNSRSFPMMSFISN